MLQTHLMYFDQYLMFDCVSLLCLHIYDNLEIIEQGMYSCALWIKYFNKFNHLKLLVFCFGMVCNKYILSH